MPISRMKIRKYDDPKKEFTRGYNFGKRDGADELMAKIIKAGGRFSEKFETDEVLVAIPKEYFIQLRKKASETA